MKIIRNLPVKAHGVIIEFPLICWFDICRQKHHSTCLSRILPDPDTFCGDLAFFKCRLSKHTPAVEVDETWSLEPKTFVLHQNAGLSNALGVLWHLIHSN